MKKTITTILLTIFFFGNQNAQQNQMKNSIKNRKNAFGVSFGTGIGLDYSRTWIQNKIYITASYNTLVYSLDGIEQEISGEDVVSNTNIDFKNFDIKLSYHPFSNAFKLVGGVGFFTSNNINILTTFKDNITIGDVEFSSDDSGEIDINFNWTKTAPYVGLGFGRVVPNKRLGFAFDLGTYFSSSPEIILDATGVIEQTEDQEALLNESFESFKFIPYASFRLSYSF